MKNLQIRTLTSLFIIFLLPNLAFLQSSIIDSLDSLIELEQEIVDSLDLELKASKDEIARLILEKNDSIRADALKHQIETDVLATVKKDFGPFKFYNKDRNQIGSIKINAKITLLLRVGKWYKVRYNSKVGFISALYLKLHPSIALNYPDTEISETNEDESNLSLKAKSSHSSSYKSSTRTSSYNSSTKGKTWVKGHYRTSKYGKKYWVKGHYRKT